MPATRPLLSITLLLSGLLSGPALAEYPFESLEESELPPETVAPMPSRPARRGLRNAAHLARDLLPKIVPAGHDSPLIDASMLNPPSMGVPLSDGAVIEGPMTREPMAPGAGSYGTPPENFRPYDGGPNGNPPPETGPYSPSPYGSEPYGDGASDFGPYGPRTLPNGASGNDAYGSDPYRDPAPDVGPYGPDPYGDGPSGGRRYGARPRGLGLFARGRYADGPPGAGPYSGDPYGGDPYGGGPYGRAYDTVPYDGYGEGFADEFDPAGGPPFDEPYPHPDELFGFERAIWPGFISGNLTPGTDRFLFGGELFVPLYQDGRTMWYFNFRGQGDDDSAEEFNTGTGVRTLTDPGWIFGAYTYWDHLQSKHGNSFNQGMIGVEAMSVLWDARMNVYFPESGAKNAGPAVAGISGGNLVVRYGIERAYWGMDFELGHLLWAYGPNAQHELRGFAAIYHFDHSAAGYSSITGPRVRGEYRWHDLPYFGPGSRFTFGLTLQADDERDGQLFAFARLRIPLDAWAHSRKPLSPLHRRMLDNVVRDVDVVTNTARQTERALNPVTGREIRGYARIDANTSNVDDLLDDLDTDSVIVLDGSKGVLHAATGYQLKSGQTVIGADTPFNVVGANSRRRATFHPKGERPTLDFGHDVDHGQPQIEAFETQGLVPFPIGSPVIPVEVAFDAAAPTYGLQMNDNTQLIGVDIQNVGVGVGVRDADNVLVQDVEISDFSIAGIEVSHSSNVKLDNVRVRDAWVNNNVYPAVPAYYPAGTGIRIGNSNNVEVTDSLVDDTQREGILIAHSQNVAIRDTKIRDTPREGIRLVNTKNVLIEDVELKNTGAEIPDAVDWALTSPYWPGSITLRQTENTKIRDTSINSSHGYGIYGEDAVDTLIERLEITGVEHGIGFYNTENMTITDTMIRLQDGMPVNQGGYVPPHSGIALGQSAGEVLVADNHIQGGYAGWGIAVESGAPSTTLWIEDNVIEKHGESRGIGIQTGYHHQLDAAVAGNIVKAPGDAFWLFAADASNNVDKSLTVTDNEFDGPINARILGSAELELIFEDNHIGGNPMGKFRAEDDARLFLQYRGNTSESGAEVIVFESDDDGEILSESGAISGNNHQPDVSSVITIVPNAAQ